jgi:polyketide cyclase/dehydrase/lipid transport protein
MPNDDRTGSANPDGASAKGGVGVDSSVTINKPVDELYRFWRHFENLPRFMRHLESVTAFNNTRSHWVAKTPDDTKIEWDADLIEERPNELIAWCGGGQRRRGTLRASARQPRHGSTPEAPPRSISGGARCGDRQAFRPGAGKPKPLRICGASSS